MTLKLALASGMGVQESRDMMNLGKITMVPHLSKNCKQEYIR